MIKTEPELVIKGIFLRRENRFVATVQIDEVVYQVHVPNSGRMKELLIPGTTVALIKKKGEHRKTGFQLTWVLINNIWVNIDSANPNRLIAAGVANGRLSPFNQYILTGREVTVEDSRLDLLLSHKITGNNLYLETKSVTLVEQRTAKFPDAPTVRGRKHLHRLSLLAQAGNECAVVFVVQREDADYFQPNNETDSAFGQSLLKAKASGVQLFAYTCCVELGEIKLDRLVPVKLN